MNNQTTAACGSMQEQQQKPNVQDEPAAESAQAGGANAAREPQAGSGSAPSPCSALGASDKQSCERGAK